jgi:general L-amino acid transport system permease protein
MSVVSGGDAPPKVAFFNDPKVRSIAVQSALVLVVAYFAWSIFNNTVANLREANIASGFGFLESTAGFDLSFTLIPYSESSTYGRAVVVGILNTMLVAVCGIILATIIGFIVGVMRLSKNWLVSKVAEVYIEVMRNVPLLIQIFIWYKVVLAALPHPRNAISLGGTFFLSNRGITIRSSSGATARG